MQNERPLCRRCETPFTERDTFMPGGTHIPTVCISRLQERLIAAHAVLAGAWPIVRDIAQLGRNKRIPEAEFWSRQKSACVVAESIQKLAKGK